MNERLEENIIVPRNLAAKLMLLHTTWREVKITYNHHFL